VWSPRLRPLVLAGAVVLHVGIGACLGMWTFGLIMLVGCASFLPAGAVRQLVAAPAPGRARATPAGAASPAGPRDAVAALPRATVRAAD
ncbi:MAG: hypothetical protein JOZ63_06785, partial [Planctomycetaceae bacterium]|nr:hypothetical protein [Planctomycetaceae bacterium]